MDVQGYIALIADGRYREAVKLIKQVLPFPLVIGRVCPRPCETECRRNAVDEPVGIDYLKRFVADRDMNDPRPYSPPVAPPTGKRIAMVGAGPGSLTAAYFLAQKGHSITIFEALPKPGGMLRYGIPEYRLPRDVLDHEIGTITDLGVKIECGKALGRDFVLRDLFEQGFHAAFLGMGAMASRKMQVPGEELGGVWAGTEFLKGVGLGNSVEIGSRIAIIGGGNTAIDASRTVLRLGAEKSVIVYRRSRTEMPAWSVEVDAALHEGVEMHFLAAPVKIEGSGRCECMECIKMELGEPDDSGRRRPVPVEGSEFTIEVDNIIAAIGQHPELKAITDTAERDPESLEAGLELTRWGTIVADEETLATAADGVFAGGDVVSGAATAVEAIAAGGKAAGAIDRYLAGVPLSSGRREFSVVKERWDEIPIEELKDVEKAPRQSMPELDVPELVGNFEEVELGLSEEQAKLEADRCLECGCVARFDCGLKDRAEEYGAVFERFVGEVGRHPIDERHPYIRREPEKCIMCGRCVRICLDVQGAAALGFFKRGFDVQAIPTLDEPLAATECESCGQCVSSCPTAALSVKTCPPKPGPWELEQTRSTCTYCGAGCAISLDTDGGRLVTVGPAFGQGVNEGNLCVRGRFGLEHIGSSGRLEEPAIMTGRAVKPCTLKEGVASIADGLSRLFDKHGPGSVAVFASPRLTNEEAFWTQKLARRVAGTPNVASFGLVLEDRAFGALRSAFGYAASTASYSDLARADGILMIDSDIAEEQAVPSLFVRKAVRRGAKLVVLSPTQTRMSRLADVWVKVDRGRLGDLLRAMVRHALREGVDGSGAATAADIEALRVQVDEMSVERTASELSVPPDMITGAVELLARSERSVLVANAMSFDPNLVSRDASLTAALALLCGTTQRQGSGILFLRMRANGQGLCDAGVSPGYLPGQLPEASSVFVAAPAGVGRSVDRGVAPTDAVHLFSAMERGDIKGALIIGEDPVAGASDPDRVRSVLRGLDFLAALDIVSTRTTELAHVVLPMAASTETEGTFTNSERRLQPVAAACDPPGGVSNLEILARIADGLGHDLGDPDHRLVRSELAAETERLGLPCGDIPAGGVVWGGDPLYADGFATGSGLAEIGVAEDQALPLIFDPRWCDAVEVGFSDEARRLGLRPHVVRRYGV